MKVLANAVLDTVQVRVGLATLYLWLCDWEELLILHCHLEHQVLNEVGLVGARFAVQLAVPDLVFDEGFEDLADLSTFARF